MDIQQLKYFITLSQLLNFTKVAEIYFTTQPTICRRISALEEEVGVTLVNRSTHGVTLTRGGQEFVQHATEIVNIAETAIQSLQKSEASPAKILKIAAFSSSEDILLSCTGSFSQLRPDIQVIVDTLSGRPMLAALDNPEYSFYFLHTKYVDNRTGFQYIPTRYEESYFVVRECDSDKVKGQDFSALADTPFVCVAPADGMVLYDLFIRTCSALKIIPHIVNLYTRASSALLGVKMGIGNTILPASLIRSTSGVSIYPIHESTSCLDSCVAWRSYIHSPEIDAFQSHLFNVLKPELIDK